MNDLITIKQALSLVPPGTDPKTLRNWIVDGITIKGRKYHLPATLFGRKWYFRSQDLTDFVNKLTQTAKA